MISQTANNFDLGPRWGSWLRDQVYRGPHAAKRIARDLDVSEGTAKLWLSGKRPTSEYIEEGRRRWGWRFVQFLFAPPGVENDLDIELRQLRQRIARLEEVVGDETLPEMAGREDADLLARNSVVCDQQSGDLAPTQIGPAATATRRRGA